LNAEDFYVEQEGKIPGGFILAEMASGPEGEKEKNPFFFHSL